MSAESVSASLPHPSDVDGLVRVPFGHDDYLALPEHHRAEYVGGMAVVSPSASYDHQVVAQRLVDAIRAGCPDLGVVQAVGVHTGERRHRIPDVVAVRDRFEGAWAPASPVIVAEVSSPSTRREDLVRKSTEYHEAGIAQYWIVDRDERTVVVLGHTVGGWDYLLELGADTTSGVVAVDGFGEVSVDVDTLFAP